MGFFQVHDGVPTENTHCLVVDYHGISRELEEFLSSFEWEDVQDAMHQKEEDPAPVIEAASVQSESHFNGLDLSDT